MFSGGCTQPGVAQGADDLFAQYTIVTGPTERQTLLTGFLLDGPVAEIAVVNIDENGGRRLRIHAFECGTWGPRGGTTLRPQVLFVDVAEIDGRDRLISYEPGRLNWFDPESVAERELVAVASGFKRPRRDEIPHVDITHDVNADGRDDLVVPGIDGFHVLVQMQGGAFADPVTIGPAPDLSRIYGADGYRYDPWSQSRVHEMDFNHDGRVDLVFWNGNHFEVHIQDERGLFGARAEAFTTDVAFDSDDLSFLAEGDMTGRVLHSLADLNADGVGDLVVHALEGKGISEKRSTYEVHFGAPTLAGGTAFAPEIGAAFESEDHIQIGLYRHDFDGDGQIDLMLTTVRLEFLEGSLWKRIKGAMGDDVWLDLEFYRMREGSYPDQPDTIRRIALDGPPSHREPGWVPPEIVLRGGKHEARRAREIWPRAFNMILFIGDVTGDGRCELVIENTHRGLPVFVGASGPDLFARRPREVAVPVPGDEEYAWLVDLNRDGKQDVLMHHPFTLRDPHGARKLPLGSEPHRINILIAR